MKNGTRLLLVVALAVGTVAFGYPHASAQLVSPFGRNWEGQPLSAEDRELMTKAMREALEKYTVGAVSVWESTSSGRAGRAVVTEIFERDGMRCGQLTHQFTKGPGKTYSAPMCKTADGSWKLAF